MFFEWYSRLDWFIFMKKFWVIYRFLVHYSDPIQIADHLAIRLVSTIQILDMPVIKMVKSSPIAEWSAN